jgi:hypothetical protein
MIEKLRNDLWEAMYLNPVWPHELLENAKDPSYNSVNFKPCDSGTEVELLFTDEGALIKSVYTFDSEEHLQRAVIIENETESVIYDRAQLVASILNQITSYSKNEKANQVTA